MKDKIRQVIEILQSILDEPTDGGLNKQEIHNLRDEFTTIWKTLMHHDVHRSRAFAADLRSRYGVSNINDIPAQDLHGLIGEIQEVLDR